MSKHTDSIIMMTPQEMDDGGDDGDMHMQNCCCVPAETISEEGVPPEEGDEVSFSVDGTVKHVEDGCIYVKISKVNGQDVSDKAQAPSAENTEDTDTDDDMQNLQSAASAHDQGQGM